MIRDNLKTLHPYKPRAFGAYVHPVIFMRSGNEFCAHLGLNSSGSEINVQVGAAMMSLEQSMAEIVTKGLKVVAATYV